MKTALTILLGITLPFACLAQQPAKPQKTVTVETTHEHRDASHYHTHTTVAPVEHHTITKWHYHSGVKQPQAPKKADEQTSEPKKKTDRTPAP